MGHGVVTKHQHEAAQAAELSVLHRLAIIYLMLPVGVFLVGWLHWWIGIPAAALVVAGLWKMLGGAWPLSWPRPVTFALLLAALAWVMATAAGGVFDTHNGDWPKHRSVLTDLAVYPWPVRIPDPLADFLAPDAARPDALLRYYLGYYAVPGLLGSWFGPAALNWAVPLWTWAGVALLVLLFARRFAGNLAAIVATVVLIAFSGMDALRMLLLFGEVPLFSSSGHLETDDFLRYRIQYTSNMAALMWVPQHFIASGLYTMLLLQLGKEPRFLASAGLLLGACLLWSPFVAIGLLPLLAVLLLDNGWRRFLSWQNLSSVALAVLLIAYLTGDASAIVSGWVWQQGDWGETVRGLLIFYLTEFLVLSCLLWFWQPQLRRERFFVASFATLCVLPFYTFGYFNDLGMRASLPALMVLCWYCAQAVANGSPRQRVLAVNASGPQQQTLAARRRQRSDSRPARRARQPARRVQEVKETSVGAHRSAPSRKLVFGLVAALLAVGAMTPLQELIRASSAADGFRYERQLHSISTHARRPARSQFVAHDVPGAVATLLPMPAETTSAAESWQLVISSHFDVYVNGKVLLYTRTPCVEEDLLPLLFLQVWPTAPRDLPRSRRQRGFSEHWYEPLVYTLWNGPKCAFIRKLPEYPIDRVVTGQLDGRKRLWQGTISFAPPASSARPP